MAITTFSSREFNQDVSKIKKATTQGPVFITDRGHLAHVFLSISFKDSADCKPLEKS